MKYGITLKINMHTRNDREEDESTIECSQVNYELKNLFDFDDLCKVRNTPVRQPCCLSHWHEANKLFVSLF